MKTFTIGLKLFSFSLLTTLNISSLFALESIDVGNFKLTFYNGNEGKSITEDITWTTEQKEAARRAVQTWNNTITTEYNSNSTNLFNVNFYFNSLDNNTLASAGAPMSGQLANNSIKLRSAIEAVWRDGGNFAQWNSDINNATVYVNVNALDKAYWGASATEIKSNQTDFESVLLHEMGHIMGISSYLIANASNSISMMTNEEKNTYYTTFDSKIQHADGTYLIDLDSSETTDNLASTGDPLYINGVQLYNPVEYNDGSSLSHINAGDNEYMDLYNSGIVMKYASAGNQVLRNFSEQDLTILRAIGWEVIPEPSMFGLFIGLGALVLIGTKRRRNK